MKKLLLGLLVFVLLFTGCNNDNDPVAPKISVNIPPEFHGVWESVEPDPKTGLKDIMTIKPNDVITGGASIVDTLNGMLNNLWNSYQEADIPFDFTYGNDSPVHGRYYFSYTVSASGMIATTSLTLELKDDGSLDVVIINALPSDYPSGEYPEYSQMAYNKI